MILFFLASFALVIALGAYFYFHFINAKMAETAKVTGKAATVASATGLSRYWALIEGWKTHILAWAAAVVALLVQLPSIIGAVLGYLDEDALRAWQAAPWANIVDAKVASWLTLGLALVIPITHSIGVNKAAKTVPMTPPGEV